MLKLMDNPPRWGRTLRTYLILIWCAKNRRTITYGKLARLTHEHQLSVSGIHLDPIYNYCEAMGCPAWRCWVLTKVREYQETGTRAREGQSMQTAKKSMNTTGLTSPHLPSASLEVIRSDKAGAQPRIDTRFRSHNARYVNPFVRGLRPPR